MKEKKISNVVIYARYSSAGQRDESIEGQIRECTEYAVRKGYSVIGTYSDRALTGTTDRRPEFQKMIADSEKGTFDAVICWKHDRFARNRYDAALYKAKLKNNGVSLVYAKEDVPEGPEGIIIDSVMEGYAEYYSANLSQNVKRGLYESALKRQTMGVRLLGYKEGADKRFEIDETTAPIVRYIFEQYASGTPSKKIVDELNGKGYKTASGGKFLISSIEYIIKNEKYKGLYRYDDIEDENGVPRIISPELWEQANIEMEKWHHAPARTDISGGYLLSGKLFCGMCREAMTAAGGYGRGHKRYDYYMCNGKRHHNGCSKHNVPKEYIENRVVDILRQIVLSDAIVEQFAERFEVWQEQQNNGSELPAMQKNLEDTEKGIANLTKALEGGLVSETVSRRVAELEEQKRAIEHSIGEFYLKRPQMNKEEVVFFLTSFRKGNTDDPKFRSFLIRTFLQAIYLYDDGRLLLHLNYTGECNIVSVDMLNQAVNDGEQLFINSQTTTLPVIDNSKLSIFYKDGEIVVIAYM